MVRRIWYKSIFIILLYGLVYHRFGSVCLFLALSLLHTHALFPPTIPLVGSNSNPPPKTKNTVIQYYGMMIFPKSYDLFVIIEPLTMSINSTYASKKRTSSEEKKKKSLSNATHFE